MLQPSKALAAVFVAIHSTSARSLLKLSYEVADVASVDSLPAFEIVRQEQQVFISNQSPVGRTPSENSVTVNIYKAAGADHRVGTNMIPTWKCPGQKNDPIKGPYNFLNFLPGHAL